MRAPAAPGSSGAIACLLTLLAWASPVAASDVVDTIARVKQSVVAVGTFERARTPPFQFRGTGFAVGDGTMALLTLWALRAQPGTASRSRKQALT